MQRQISESTRAKLSAAGKKRAAQFTPEYQRQTRSKLPHEACVLAGKAAYKKLVEKYGLEYAMDKAAEWRLTNPSSLEVIVMDWVQDVEHVREAKIRLDETKVYYVDFLFGNIVVEVNGEWVHSQRTDRDSNKYKNLTAAGYTVVVLPERDILSGEAKIVIDKLFKS